MHKSRLRLLIAALVSCVPLAHSALGAPYEAYTVTSAGVTLATTTDGRTNQSGTITSGPASSSAPAENDYYSSVLDEFGVAHVTSGHGESASSASVFGGVLRGSATGSVGMSPPDGGTATCNSFATAHFNDTLEVLSDTLAAGTLIQLEVTSTLHIETATPSVYIDSITNSSASLDYLATVNGLNGGDTSFYYTVGDGVGGYVAPGVYTETQIIDLHVGETFYVVGNLHMGGVASNGGYAIDASNTANIYLNPLDPSVSFSAASGATYSAVPEPGTFGLASFGVSTLLIRRKRR